jgi:sigma-B regulation protein RsbU (phosphoserine phosphatase)
VRAHLQHAIQWTGRAGVAFAVTSLAWLILSFTGMLELLRIVFGIGAWVTGAWLALRIARWAAERAVWRLRHRLIVTYLFLAVAPVLLLLAIATAGAYSLLLQVAMNVVTTELDHRQQELAAITEAARDVAPSSITAILDPFFTRRYPGLLLVAHRGNSTTRIPADAEVPPPVVGFDASRGIVHRKGIFFLWANRKLPDGDITVVAPLNGPLLAQLAPELGVVTLERNLADFDGEARNLLPAAEGSFDAPLFWFALLRASEWERPGELSRDVRIGIQTRRSTALAALFNRRADVAQGFVQAFLIGGAILFVLVELICWVIGVTMTRTITNTVHHLYQGTQHIADGRFSHRMPITGRDQLAEVGTSFNRMTAHLEKLVAVAQEEERLQSEIAIAREVQDQLYPTLQTRSSHLRVAAVYRSARMVSGDYFDYETAGDGRVALAIGDVAGKGISAALLMSSIQSSLRTQLGHSELQTTEEIVTRLNRHLCASTSAAKYATFCLGLYEDATQTLYYTNAGHIPPVLIRDGKTCRLDVNGTVVGAFENAVYDSSALPLIPGDLLAWFTDGLSEPESEFGEMFGEERLIELLRTNAHKTEQQIADIVLDAIRQWTGQQDELQDDITLMLVRRL